MTILERDKPKVVVILNYYTQSIDYLDYPDEIETIVMNNYDGDLENYLDEEHNYPTSNICYMVSTWEQVENQIRFAMPSRERKRINARYNKLNRTK